VEQPSERPIRSYSQLSQIEECPEQYRLKRIERLAETPAVWFPAGNAFHGITEGFDRYAVQNGLHEAALIDWADDWPMVFGLCIEEERAKTDLPVEEWRTAGRTKEDIPWWNEHGPDMVRSYVNWRVENQSRYGIWVAPDGTPAIEWEGLASLGAIPVTAKADRVFIDLKTGATIIVDLKAGREPEGTLQLRVYRMVIERVTDEPMWYGAYYMARKGEMTKPIPLDATNEYAIERRFEIAEEMIEGGIFPPRPSPRNCRQCGFKAHCIFAEDE
jgi:CRISPR/Cas system-associated exonuclease Cas4 (RecB family)